MDAQAREDAGLRLEREAEELQEKVESLKRQLEVQATALISAQSTRRILESLHDRQGPLNGSLQQPGSSEKDLVLVRLQAQDAHNQQCLYRIGASVTSFKVQDPDPNAVNNGRVLGLRFEIMTKAKFLRPYYVMLNRPYPNSRFLRIHRHTVPPCIPLSGLAARHLPPPKAADASRQASQDLAKFVRLLRREVVRYHNRIAAIADMRNVVGLGSKKTGDSPSPFHPVSDISAADSEAKQIKIEWHNGRTGRLVTDEDGNVVKFVVWGENGRDRETVRQLMGDKDTRIEEFIDRLGKMVT